MVFVADAFATWLIEQISDAAKRHLIGALFGSEQERALRVAATNAIRSTADAIADNLQDRASEIAAVIDQVFTAPSVAPTGDQSTFLEALNAGVAQQLAILGDRDVTGIGQSSAETLGVQVSLLSQQLTQNLVRQILAMGTAGGPLAPLANQLNHDMTHLQGRRLELMIESLSANTVASLNCVAEQIKERSKNPESPRRNIDLGRPLGQIDPLALEIHPAVDLDRVDLPQLPSYVRRCHDDELKALVNSAQHISVIGVLVGESSTGKTRACWEAVKELPDEWRLWHPIDPSRPEAVLENLPLVRARTVIWLNELQFYLLTPGSDLGERVAAGLRELLRSPERGPILALGTIWPYYWAELTTPANKEGDDLHAQARALLTGTHITVPDAFSKSEIASIDSSKIGDARLSLALSEAEGGQVTQYLAGVPALLERYRTAPASARALIHAAMDARRIEYAATLPRTLLEKAAPGYLSDVQWDALEYDWIEKAFAYLAIPCRGTRGPVTRIRTRPGQSRSNRLNYRLADFLEQLGRWERRHTVIPGELWEAFLTENTAPKELMNLARQADYRGLYRYSMRLVEKAAKSRDPEAMESLSERLRSAGEEQEADYWLQQAADAGHTRSMVIIADKYASSGDADEALAWYRRANESGAWGVEGQLIELLEHKGCADEAIEVAMKCSRVSYELIDTARLMIRNGKEAQLVAWLRNLIEEGNDDAMVVMAKLLQQKGELDQACALLLRAVHAGNGNALEMQIDLLEDEGREHEIEPWLKAIADKGNFNALMELVGRLQEESRPEEAIALFLSKATDKGNDSFEGVGLIYLTGMLVEAGRSEEALALLSDVAAGADESVYSKASFIIMQVNRYRNSDLQRTFVELLKAVMENGSDRPTVAVILMLDLLRLAGREVEAISLSQRVLEQNPALAEEFSTEVSLATVQTEDAIHELQSIALRGNFRALHRVVIMLKEANRTDEAIAWLMSSVETGVFGFKASDALRLAVQLLEEAGRAEEADRLRRDAGLRRSNRTTR